MDGPHSFLETVLWLTPRRGQLQSLYLPMVPLSAPASYRDTAEPYSTLTVRRLRWHFRKHHPLWSCWEGWAKYCWGQVGSGTICCSMVVGIIVGEGLAGLGPVFSLPSNSPSWALAS